MPELSPSLPAFFTSPDTYIRSLGDGVQRKDQKVYVGYRRLKNFASVVGHTQKNRLLLYLHLDATGYSSEERKFLKDIRGKVPCGPGATLVYLQDTA
jgi:predicted transport protein